MNDFEKILAITSSALSEKQPQHGQVFSASTGNIGQALFSLLQRKNGFYAFESALHVIAFDAQIDWNKSWKKHYGTLLADYWCFAEDIFANPFAIKDNAIFQIDAETAEATWLADTLLEFFDVILKHYDDLTGYPLAHAWQENNGALANGKRLLPKIPFVLGGDYHLENLYACDGNEAIRLRGDMACQINPLADGEKVIISNRMNSI